MPPVETCPDCAAPIDHDPRVAPWCPACDWNVLPEGPAASGWMDRWHARLAHGLHGNAVRGRGGRIAKIASYTVAVLVHLFTVALIVGGVWLVTRLHVVGVVLGVAALGLAWLLLPRPGRLPEGEPLGRDAAPELHRLVEEVAGAIRAPRPHLILVNGEVNAAIGTYGMLRRRFLVIGYPLWILLDPQERVALLGHEMGHTVNGDARHGFVVGSAMAALEELWLTARDPDEGGLVEILTRGVMWTARTVVSGVYLLLLMLTLRASQAAEYRADRLAAEVGGTEAAASLMDGFLGRLPIAAGYLETSAHMAREDLWGSVRRYVDAVPESELERRRRAARLGDVRVDETHPPTHLRHDFLTALPYREPLVRAAAMEAIDRELEQVAARVARAAAERSRAALYG
ncbi:M48 family metallopeptidase [Thermoactinospora rubra]|uniref:M48 family metallopeptidase n=1 Tax=Thermoactinospora rubra TaxID=1088767 RepID=UPI000A0FFC47|nr:M48 family metallopeptidase [Thermoactinospora rubra]